MTVKELLDVCPCCDLVEVVVRKGGDGLWIQGYRVGEDVKLFPAEIWKETLEKNKLKKTGSCAYLAPDQEVDTTRGIHLPMKVICKPVHKIPDYIGKLQVCYAIPRHIPMLHKDPATHNEFSFDISAYPDGWEDKQEPEEKKPETDLLGQMTLEDLKEVEE